jgi:hypothetical protein
VTDVETLVAQILARHQGPCVAGESVRHPEWGDENWRCTQAPVAVIYLEDCGEALPMCQAHYDFVTERLDKAQEGK